MLRAFFGRAASVMESEQERLQRPGFGMKLEEMPPWSKGRPVTEWDRFPHAIKDFFASEGVTLREQRMLDFISQITDKPRWWEKINDEEIVSRWWAEASGGDDLLQLTSSRHLSKKCFDYCLAELRDKAHYLEKHGVIHVLDTNATVVKADIDPDDSFWLSLKRCAWKLEDVSDLHKDWHPGSNGMVLDLLHPSLFPLRYGQSRVLPRGIVPLDGCAKLTGLGEVCAVPDAISQENQFSKNVSWGNSASLQPWGRMQWLPSEIKFGSKGSSKITSYINNLHPEVHGELYCMLEQAVDRAVPLWNECLSWWFDRTRLIPDSLGIDSYVAPTYPGYPDDGDEVTDAEDDDDWARECDMREHYSTWIHDHPEERLLLQPDPREYEAFQKRIHKHAASRLDLRGMFSGGLQVIFKLANIHLTPGKPTYGGSNWHIEGALNEHICATALFYYDSSNVKDNFLEFRNHVDAEEMVGKPEQHEYIAAEDMYGIKNEGAAVQRIGHVLTRPGRWIAFPNVMQHKVSPFSLADATKPGHRKILAMFLVDPHINILSTANVPPQRVDWWAEEVKKIPPFSDLPVELFERVIEEVQEFPVNWETACNIREELMAERGRITDEVEEMLAEDTFYFCEH